MNPLRGPHLLSDLICVAILCFLAGCGDGIDRSEDPVKMVFGGRHFSVPNGFFEPLFFPDLKEEPDSFFMRAYWPDYTAGPTRPVAEARQGGHEDRIIIRLTKRAMPLQASYAAIAAERIETVPFHDAHGLRAFYATPSRMHDAIRREVHFAHQEQVVTILIICETGHRSPPCDHKFNAVGLGFTLTYSIDHLTDWRAIQDGVTALVAGFIEDAP